MKQSTLVITILLGIVVLSVVGILVASLSGLPSTGDEGGETIMFIPLTGAIADALDSGLLGAGAGITPDFVRHRLDDAEQDPSVKAIIFKLDSPGGAVGASQEIATLVRGAKKPVVVFAGDTIASGGYYIASQADKVVAKPGSLIGSIGVISMIPDLSGLYAKLGIKMQTIKSGKNKDMFERALTPEERAKFQALSDELYRQFVGDVARGRKLKREEVQELATGELFPASKAKQLGLVDELGGYQKAVDVAADLAGIEDPIVKEYEPPTLIEELVGAPYSRISGLIRMGLLGKLGKDLVFLEHARSTYGLPQYRYIGGH